METIVVLGLFLALLVIVGVDTHQKRRKYLDGGE